MTERLKHCLLEINTLTIQEKIAVRDYLIRTTANTETTTPQVSVPKVRKPSSELIPDDDERFKDKRKSRRFKVEINGTGILLRETATLKDNKRFQIKILDISREGIRFRARKKILTKDVLLLNFRLKDAGFKKTYIEVVWCRDLSEDISLNKEYEYGGCVISDIKVQHIMVDLERSLRINDLLSKRNFRIICCFPPLMGHQIVKGLAMDGYQIEEVNNYKDIVPRLLGVNFSMMVIDELILKASHEEFFSQVRKYRSELLIVLMTRSQRTQEKLSAESDVQVITPYDTPLLEVQKCIEQTLRFSLYSNWQLITQTKLKFILFTTDRNFIAHFEENMRSIKHFFFLETIGKEYPQAADLDLINTFDFLFIDFSTIETEKLMKITQLLPPVYIPRIGVDRNYDKKALAIHFDFDDFIRIPNDDDKLEQRLMQLFKKRRALMNVSNFIDYL